MLSEAFLAAALVRKERVDFDMSDVAIQSTGAQNIESQEQVQHENAKEHAIPGPTTSLPHPARATM